MDGFVFNQIGSRESFVLYLDVMWNSIYWPWTAICVINGKCLPSLKVLLENWRNPHHISLKYSDKLFWGLQVKLTCKDILHGKLGLVHHLFQLIIQSPDVDKRFAAHNNGDQKYKLWLYRQSLV